MAEWKNGVSSAATHTRRDRNPMVTVFISAGISTAVSVHGNASMKHDGILPLCGNWPIPESVSNAGRLTDVMGVSLSSLRRADIARSHVHPQVSKTTSPASYIV
jgi:hypothetical protein